MSDERRTKNPLRFHTKPYRGAKDALRREYAARIAATQKVENHLNSIMRDDPQIATVFEIAEAIHIPEETVRKILMENGHGYNGITF